MEFRTLTAEEVKCRIGQISQKKGAVSLLIYKDARVDMDILDETVGPQNWQRLHYECKGNLFCKVGIRMNSYGQIEGDQWVWKSDVGTESNTEEEKGESSDSFKRACTNFGIGRELYTAPVIWVPQELAKTEDKDGKWICKKKFKVTQIEYDEDRNITKLEIGRLNWNETEIEEIVFAYGYTKSLQEVANERPDPGKMFRTEEPPKEYKRK